MFYILSTLTTNKSLVKLIQLLYPHCRNPHMHDTNHLMKAKLLASQISIPSHSFWTSHIILSDHTQQISHHPHQIWNFLSNCWLFYWVIVRVSTWTNQITTMTRFLPFEILKVKIHLLHGFSRTQPHIKCTCFFLNSKTPTLFTF